MSPAECQLMGITDTSFANVYAASNWVTFSLQDGGSMILRNIWI